MRRTVSRDVNHVPIRDGLARLPGVSVWDVSHLGGGMSDLLVARGDLLVMLEIKRPDTTPSKRKPRREQVKVAELFPKHYRIVTSLEEALRVIGLT